MVIDIEGKDKREAKQDKSPILFRMSNLDFDTDEEYESFMEFKKELTENRKASDFYKKAVIQLWKIEIGREKEQYDKLFDYVEKQGIEVILNKIENQKNNKEIEKIIEKYNDKLISKLEKHVITLKSDDKSEEIEEGYDLTEDDQDFFDDLT